MEAVMKRKIKEFTENSLSEIEYRLRRLCGRPTPAKRLVAVLIMCIVFAVANIWFVVSSIYSIGKKDAEKELIKLQHIETLELPVKQLKDKNNHNQLNNNEHEYEQSNDGRKRE
jgi:hypothetical protein